MRFGVLGPLEVSSNGQRIALGGPKQRLVLAHLLIRANELVTADLLIDEIWGDEPPDAARASLHSYVSHLKKALGAERLVSRPPGYVLRAAPDELDASRFEQMAAAARRRLASDPAGAGRALREALAIWRGEPYADLAHELSLHAEVERLIELRLVAIEDRLEAELALGRHAELVSELERLVGHHSLRERLCGQLMLALYRSGRQAEALAAYHRLRTALDELLGVEPSPAIEELQRAILNHDPALELGGQPLRGYRLVEQVGAGPLGVVHRAFEPQTEREVAIKVLSAAVANDAHFVRRFEADARRAAQLEHPHVAPLLDWWREPDAAYVVMPLLHGGNLADLLSRAQPDSASGLRWAEQLGGALAVAHRQGVIHGDIRPANVLLDADANAYLSDFAVGYDPAELTDDGRRAGALRYLAPERHDGGSPSPAADIYAFGVLLSEIFAGVTAGADGSSLRSTLGRATAANPDERPRAPNELVAAVRRALLAPTTEALPTDHTPPTRNPYKGLRAFEEIDAHDFFGRAPLVAQLIQQLAGKGPGSRLLAIVGPSGSGKSSLVSAGLLPAVRAGAVPGSEEWLIASLTPGERPFDQLEQALLSVAVDASASLGQLVEVRAGLGRAVERLLPARAQLLLIIDQFEELFTRATGEATQAGFLQLLAATVEDLSAPVRLVITLRADFYDRPLRHEHFGRLLAAATQGVPPLTPEELEQVISRPAARAGLELEAGLVARMVAEMSEQPGALPLLQYSLAELWERRERRRLSLHAYEASGGIAGAVGRRAEQLVRELDAEGRETARQLFLRLVELGEGVPDTARRVAISELHAIAVDHTRLETIIDGFARFRLLLFDRDPESRQPTLELAHEALLRAWPRVQQWVDEARDDMRQQRRLAQAASQWLAAGRDPSFLLTGNRLVQAAQWSGGTRVLLAPTEREYLDASLAERERLEAEEAQRQAHEEDLERRAIGRLRALVVTFALGALLAGVLSVFAWGEGQRAERTAREATARELSTASVANLNVDPERSILLALEAVDITRSVDGIVLPEAEEALHRAVRTSRLVRTFPHGGYGLAVTSDGSRIATGGSDPTDNTVTIWETNTGEQLLVIPDQGPGRALLAFSPDDRLLATAPNDGTVRLWDPATGAQRQILSRPDRIAQMPPTFSPDGRWVAAPGFPHPTVMVWDVATGAEVMTLRADAEPFAVIAFSPDGSWLASGHGDGSVWIWDLTTQLEVRILADHQDQVNQIAFSPDSTQVATASADGTILITDTQTWDTRTLLADASVGALAYSPDGTRLAAGGWDSRVIVWDAETGRRQLTLGGHAASVQAVAFLPGTDILLTGGLDNTTRLWDVSVTGARDWLTVRGGGFRSPIAFSPDSKRLAVSADDGGVTIMDSNTGETELVLDGHTAGIGALAFSPGGRTLAAAGRSESGPILALFDIDAADPPLLLEGHDGFGVPDVGYSTDGQRLVSAGFDDGTVRLWDIDLRSLLHVIPTGSQWVLRAAISPDGELVAAVGESEGDVWMVELHVFDADTGARLQRIQAHNLVAWGLAFAPDGRLVTASEDSTAIMWDLDTGEALWTFHHDTPVTDVAVSPDGTRIATALVDGTARIWDLTSGRHLLTLYGYDLPVERVAFSPDGRLLATGDEDGTVALHLLPIDEFVELARTRVTRTLTDDECGQYLHLEACPAD